MNNKFYRNSKKFFQLHVVSFQKNRGFTLIELLISLIVISLIGGVILSIFFSVLRGSNKTNNLILVRQEGEYATDQFSRMVRSAQSIVSPDCTAGFSGSTSIEIAANDGQTTTYACDLGASTLASSSANPATLIDIPANSNVQIKACSFSCSEDSNTLIPVVSFSLTLAPKGANNTSETSNVQSFSTSITLRNYGQ